MLNNTFWQYLSADLTFITRKRLDKSLLGQYLCAVVFS